MDFLGNILSGQDLVNKDYVDKVIPVVPTKLSELTNDLGLGSLAYKSSLVTSDIPDLSSKYLPLTGGTLSAEGSDIFVINRLNSTSPTTITYRKDNSLLGRMGFNTDGAPVAQVGGAYQFLIHSRNIGDYAFVPRTQIVNNTNADNLLTNGVYLNASGNGSGNSNLPNAYGVFLTFTQSDKYAAQLSIASNGMYVRRKIDTWSDWKTIAFTDSDITGNAGSADFIATAYANQSIDLGKEGKVRMIYGTASNATSLGYPRQYTSGLSVLTGYTGWQMVTYGGTSTLNPYFRSLIDNGTFSDWKQLAFLTDNVASAYKLITSVGADAVVPNANGYTYVYGDLWVWAQGASDRVVRLRNDPSDLYTRLKADGSGEIFVSGNYALKLGTANTTRMLINSSGNVGIGTTTPEYKLDVNGNIKGVNIFVAENKGMWLGSQFTAALTSNDLAIVGSKVWFFGDVSARNNLETRGTFAASGAATFGSTLSVSGAVTMSSFLSVENEIYIQNASYSTSGEGSFLIRLYNGEFQFNSRTADGASKAVPFRIEYATNMSIFNGDVRINGNLIVTGDSSSGSDIRFKDVIESKRIKIDDIANAPLFTFKWNDRQDDSIHLGTSAQYWETVAPWLVKGEDFKTLDYATLGVAIGISLANKTLSHDDEIKILKNKVKALEAEINRLRRHDN